MYFPTIDTILNLLTTGLFIFYIKKKIDENEELKRSFFLNYDFFLNTLDINLQENLYFYTDEDKELFLKSADSVNDCVINMWEFLSDKIKENYQIIKQVAWGNSRQNTNETLEENVTEEEPPKLVVIFEEKYKEEYKKAEEVELSKERLEQLKNTILIEKTPLGNVVMYYDESRETFTYYSDSTMPYRYLEVVARNYVVKNRCKKLYVDMEKELKEAQEKIENKQKEELEIKQQIEENKEKEITAPVKRNVFAKMKNYNKDTSLKSAGIPTDNKSVTKKVIPSSKNADSKNMVLKENANRYSYEGKIANFSFLKKVERKAIDKRYAMNFSDFKKMVMDKKNKT